VGVGVLQLAMSKAKASTNEKVRSNLDFMESPPSTLEQVVESYVFDLSNAKLIE
jgi:hypothetical protein